MKKENRELARKQRAKKRRQNQRKQKIKKFLSWFLPCAAILLLAAALIYDSVRSSDTTSESDDTVQESAALSTDTSLTVADGDTVNIDYTGTIDGEVFSGGSTDGTGTDLVIGSGSYIDDFEEQLIGAHPGDEVTVEVTFPDDYNSQDLQGKDAVFSVTINGIYQ